MKRIHRTRPPHSEAPWTVKLPLPVFGSLLEVEYIRLPGHPSEPDGCGGFASRAIVLAESIMFLANSKIRVLYIHYWIGHGFHGFTRIGHVYNSIPFWVMSCEPLSHAKSPNHKGLIVCSGARKQWWYFDLKTETPVYNVRRVKISGFLRVFSWNQAFALLSSLKKIRENQCPY